MEKVHCILVEGLCSFSSDPECNMFYSRTESDSASSGLSLAWLEKGKLSRTLSENSKLYRL